MENKFEVFISHSSKDHTETDDLCKFLEAYSINCFVSYRDIRKGKDFASEIIEALDMCKVVVLIHTSESDKSKDVNREICSAHWLRKPVVIFRFGNAPFNGSKKQYTKGAFLVEATNPSYLAYYDILDKVTKYVGVEKLNNTNTSRFDLNIRLLCTSKKGNERENILKFFAGRGVPSMLFGLGHYYEITNRKEQMVENYLKASEMGHYTAMCNLGTFYINETREYEKGFNYILKSTEKGDSTSLNNLAYCYMKGIGTSTDKLKGIECYKKSAMSGNTTAMIELGVCFMNGDGVSVNREQSFNYFKQAAENGDAQGMTQLAHCYKDGIGTKQNIEAAVLAFGRAAEMGNAEAQAHIGYCYEEGLFVEKNLPIAIDWYQKAANQNDCTGCNNLSMFYLNGVIVEKDIKKGIRLLEISANNGNEIAMCNLGEIYENGIYVDKDIEKSKTWYKKAADVGNDNAKQALKRLSGGGFSSFLSSILGI